MPNLVPIARRESACGQRIQARSYFPKRGTRDIMKKRLKEGQGGGKRVESWARWAYVGFRGCSRVPENEVQNYSRCPENF